MIKAHTACIPGMRVCVSTLESLNPAVSFFHIMYLSGDFFHLRKFRPGGNALVFMELEMWILFRQGDCHGWNTKMFECPFRRGNWGERRPPSLPLEVLRIKIRDPSSYYRDASVSVPLQARAEKRGSFIHESWHINNMNWLIPRMLIGHQRFPVSCTREWHHNLDEYLYLNMQTGLLLPAGLCLCMPNWSCLRLPVYLITLIALDNGLFHDSRAGCEYFSSSIMSGKGNVLDFTCRLISIGMTKYWKITPPRF